MIDIEKLKVLAEKCAKDFLVSEPFEEDRHYPLSEIESLEFSAAANPAAVLELIEEIARLREITKFDEAVACIFDCLKMTAANTGSREWDDQLEELAEEVIEYAPQYKKQWKDIVEISRERDQLKAENEKLKAQLADEVIYGYAGAFYQMAKALGISGARAESPQQVFEGEVMPALLALITERDRLAADNRALTEDPGIAL